MPVGVNYQNRRLRIGYEPSTLLSGIRNRACTALELEPSKFGLRNGTRELDLTLSYRLANLVVNANFDLVPIKDVSDTKLRIKLRLPTGKDFVSSFLGSTDVKTILVEAGVNPDEFVAILGDVVLEQEETLASLGARGAVAFSVRAKTQARAKAERPAPVAVAQEVAPPAPVAEPASMPTKTPAQTDTKPAQIPVKQENKEAPVTTSTETPASTKVTRQAAQESTLASRSSEPPELTASQFHTYYAHLHNQAQGRPMISRDTLKRIANEKKDKIESIKIRIRFPDENHLEGTFAPGETGANVYDFVRQHLRHPEHEFTLESISPTHILQAHENLVHDTDFGTRVLLVYRGQLSASKEPVLNDQALILSNEIKKNQPRPEPEPEKTKKSGSGNPAPKWFKLIKK